LHDDEEHHGPVLDDFVEWCEEHHGPVLDDFVEWCEESHLVLNTNKTKEMCIDFRKHKTPTSATSIRGQNIEIVEEYNYLGVLLDNTPQWSKCIELIYKKSQRCTFSRS
jgi:hypothetical protein